MAKLPFILFSNINWYLKLECVFLCSIGLMEALICSPDLFVVQVEMDIYTMLKKVCTYKVN